MFAALAGRAGAEANGLALTPPMGWNDWHAYYCSVSAQTVEQNALAMVNSGMKAAGYDYVNIDDCWMAPSRDSAGNLVADPTRFPGGITPVANYVHSLGLKLGIYEDAGTTTCARFPGSYGHEAQDAAAFASWGVDYVKYDRCNIPYENYPGQTEQQVQRTLYTTMSNALKATGRPFVFSMANPDPTDDPWLWAAPIANLWRTAPDVQDNYGSMLSSFESTASLFPYARPGAWNDPDLLQIGNGGSTLLEYQTEFSLWAEMAAPLIASANLTELSPAALAIYENSNVIAVDQDPLGKAGVPISSARGLWVLSKKLLGGDRAVVLFNSTETAATIATSAGAVGLRKAPGYDLQNLWTDSIDETSGAISAFVPAHGVAMFRASPLARHWLRVLSPQTVLSLRPSSAELETGHSTIIREAFKNNGSSAVKRLKLSLKAPSGWRVRRIGRARAERLDSLGPGRRVTVAFRVTAPRTGLPIALGVLTGTASYDPPGGPRASAATLGETVWAPVEAPFTTANVTGQPATFGASDGALAISSRGEGAFPSYEGALPTDSYAAIYERGASGPSSAAQVTVTSDPAGGTAGGAGLIERDAMTGQGGSPAAVVLYVASNATIEMAWNASGGRDVDTWTQVPKVVVGFPVSLRLVRSGSTYTGYYSTNGGATWATVATVTVAPNASTGAQDVGIFHASGLFTWRTTATFANLLVG
jgi:alpha-galactosidase